MSAVGGISSMAGAMMPQVVSGASMRMPPAQKMGNLFQQIDTNNSGSISKAQFDQAFQTLNPPPAFKAMGADAVFSKLDPSGTGSVSKQDFINGMKSMVTHNHPHRNGALAAQNGAAAAQTLANSTSALNALGNQPVQSAVGASGNNVNTTA